MREGAARGMEAAGGFRIRHGEVRVRTSGGLQFVDLTDALGKVLRGWGLRDGLLNVQSLHTTAAVVVNENEPLLLEDMKRTLERCAPAGAGYGHDDFDLRTVNLEPFESANGHAHCKALFLRASETLNVVDGELRLGRWQRVFLLELDGGRERTVGLTGLGE